MTDWIADNEAGSSVRAKLNAVQNKGNVNPVTTGASPVDADLEFSVTAITTGGTQGNETLHVPDFAFPVEDYVNPLKYGARHFIYLAVQTDPADVAVVTGEGSFVIKDAVGNSLATSSGNVVLDYVGASLSLWWNGTRWLVDNSANNNSSEWLPSGIGDEDTAIFRMSQGGGSSWTGDQGADTYHYVATGAAPVIVAGGWRTTALSSGGTAGVEEASFGAPDVYSIGFNHLFIFAEQEDPGDSISLTPTNIKTSAGAAIASIVFDTLNQWLLLEAYDTAEWRVVRGTATVTPE